MNAFVPLYPLSFNARHWASPLKQELKLKGVKDWLINQELENAEVDWFELAEQILRKNMTACMGSESKAENVAIYG